MGVTAASVLCNFHPTSISPDSANKTPTEKLRKKSDKLLLLLLDRRKTSGQNLSIWHARRKPRAPSLAEACLLSSSNRKLTFGIADTASTEAIDEHRLLEQERWLRCACSKRETEVELAAQFAIEIEVYCVAFHVEIQDLCYNRDTLLRSSRYSTEWELPPVPHVLTPSIPKVSRKPKCAHESKCPFSDRKSALPDRCTDDYEIAERRNYLAAVPSNEEMPDAIERKLPIQSR